MDNTYNIDFIARCIAGHNKTDIKSIIVELENVQKQVGTNKNNISEVNTALDDKVDKETGKGLSTNDFTTVEKTKLDGLAEVKSIGTGLNLDSTTGELTATGGGGGTTVNNATITIQKNGTTVDSFTSNQATDKTINITVPTSAADVSALPDTTKYAAALSLTINSSTFVMTGQLKDQNGDNLGTAQTIDLPLESVVVGGSYNSQTKKVVLTLQNGNTIEFSVADLVSGLQTELSASNKLNPAYINYDSTHRAVSDTEKSTWNGKQNALSSTQLDAVNSGIDSTKVAQIETNKNNILLYQPDLKRATVFSGTDTYSMVSNCTIAMPSGDAATVYRISAMLGQGSVGVRGIILSKTNDGTTFDTDENVLCKVEQETGLRDKLSCSDIWFNASDNPLYVYCWVKLATSGTGRVYTILERLG